jgi:hypothetical protein
MMDVVYLLGAIGFFALMLWYTHACDRLGARADVEREPLP